MPADVKNDGVWGNVFDWPLIGLHTIMAPDGTIISYGTNQNGVQSGLHLIDVWDPVTNTHTTIQHTSHTDLFCSVGMIVPETGQILISGGDARPDGNFNGGVQDVNFYDPTTQTLNPSATGVMQFARWYASAVQLGNGQIMLLGGRDDVPGGAHFSAYSRLATAEAGVATAQAEFDKSTAQFISVIGAPPSDLAPPPVPASVPATLAEALDVASVQNPDLLRARDAERQAQARVTVERATLSPRLSLVGRWDYLDNVEFVGDRQETASAQLRLSIPLFDAGYGRARTRQARINVDRARAQREGRAREVVADVASAWGELSADRKAAQSLREAAAAAAKAADGMEMELSYGMRATVDVLDARRDWQEAEIAATRADATAFVAVYDLRAAIGILGQDSLLNYKY